MQNKYIKEKCEYYSCWNKPIDKKIKWSNYGYWWGSWRYYCKKHITEVCRFYSCKNKPKHKIKWEWYYDTVVCYCTKHYWRTMILLFTPFIIVLVIWGLGL